MPARIVLLVTSPRLPAGLLTAAAWDLVRAHPVFTAADGEAAVALRAAGVPVTVIDPDPEALVRALARPDLARPDLARPDLARPDLARPDLARPDLARPDLARPDVADHPVLVWLAGPAGDQEFARHLGLRLAREPSLAELELMYGSWDPPGARLLDAVAVIDRLVSPGGDPWKRQQTHQSLAPYLIEESYEAYDAMVQGDLDALREELGDVLLQIVLHARLAEDLPDGERWNVDDVAGGLVDKMIRRNPHVFAGADVTDVAEIVDNWERIKKAEKSRDSVLDGIAWSQPALALAAQILQRAGSAGLSVPVPSGSDLGSALLGVVAQARTDGLDAEAALRRAVLEYADLVRAAEHENVGPAE